MSEDDLKKILTRPGYSVVQSQLGSKAIKSEISGAGKVPDVEPSVGHEPVCEKKLALQYTGRCRINIKVYRRRLTDPLGDCTKYHIDSLRYAGLIKDDTYSEISLTQEPTVKVETEAEERVEITLEYEDTWA